MAVQATHLYDAAYETMFDGGASPTQATSGAYMWVLVDAAYDALDTHTTGSDFGGNEIDTGDGAPIAATNLSFIKSPGAANESYFQAGTTAGGAGVVQFGPTVTISAQYLCLVKPLTPNDYATTAELIFYIDLTGNDTNLSSSSGDFTITMPTAGWYKVSQA